MSGKIVPEKFDLVFQNKGSLFCLQAEPVTFIDADGKEWNAPVGTMTDGASVPRPALIITNGRIRDEFMGAAVVHDAYCQIDNADRKPPYHSETWRDVHRMFYEACLAGGTSRAKALVMYAGVRYFGPRWDDPVAEQEQAADTAAHMAFAATKDWIERSKDGELPEPEEVDADVARREVEVTLINAMHLHAIQQMQTGPVGQEIAEAVLENTWRRIQMARSNAPDDLMYLNLQGYQYKNWAMSRMHRRDRDHKDIEDALEYAESSFQTVIDRDPEDPSALNGLGNVALFHRDYAKARNYIEKALKIEPGYRSALHDLQMVAVNEARSARPN